MEVSESHEVPLGRTIRLTNSSHLSSQSRERFKMFYKEWCTQWARGDHIGPNVALYSVLAGTLIGSGLTGAIFTNYRSFGVYLLALGVFHLFEYLTTAIFNPKRVNLDSFVYDPVKGYHHAIAASILEFWLKQYYCDWIYSYVFPAQILGGVITLAGQCFRSYAMVEASTSFNHFVASKRDQDHNLITTGVFRIARHPAYLGFYMFTLGSQLLLFNPICLIGFALVLHRFFTERIRKEEAYLIRFFNQDYVNYRNKTPTYLPFIQ